MDKKSDSQSTFDRLWIEGCNKRQAEGIGVGEDAVGNKSSADLWTIRIVPPFLTRTLKKEKRLQKRRGFAG
jgi:hypothetical protein